MTDSNFSRAANKLLPLSEIYYIFNVQTCRSIFTCLEEINFRSNDCRIYWEILRGHGRTSVCIVEIIIVMMCCWSLHGQTHGSLSKDIYFKMDFKWKGTLLNFLNWRQFLWSFALTIALSFFFVIFITTFELGGKLYELYSCRVVRTNKIMMDVIIGHQKRLHFVAIKIVHALSFSRVFCR